jgi:hypothetical protein
MKNYRIDLEIYSDKQIDILSYNKRVTTKAAVNFAKKLSLSKEYKKAVELAERLTKETGEETKVRVFVQSDENSNSIYEYGVHCMMWKNGKCIYDTIG